MGSLPGVQLSEVEVLVPELCVLGALMYTIEVLIFDELELEDLDDLMADIRHKVKYADGVDDFEVNLQRS